MFFDRMVSSFRLRRCASVGRGARATGFVWIHGPGTVTLGEGVILDADLAPIELKTFDRNSEIVLGDFVEVGPGSSIEAVSSVRVEAGACLGAFSKVMDNNFHRVSGDRLVRPQSIPVVIGERARIGDRAILLAGARVDRRAVVAPGTVVTRRTPVPEGRSARGVPAVIE